MYTFTIADIWTSNPRFRWCTWSLQVHVSFRGLSRSCKFQKIEGGCWVTNFLCQHQATLWTPHQHGWHWGDSCHPLYCRCWTCLHRHHPARPVPLQCWPEGVIIHWVLQVSQQKIWQIPHMVETHPVSSESWHFVPQLLHWFFWHSGSPRFSIGQMLFYWRRKFVTCLSVNRHAIFPWQFVDAPFKVWCWSWINRESTYLTDWERWWSYSYLLVGLMVVFVDGGSCREWGIWSIFMAHWRIVRFRFLVEFGSVCKTSTHRVQMLQVYFYVVHFESLPCHCPAIIPHCIWSTILDIFQC